MCKSALYAANTGLQTVAATDPINFGTIVRRFGQNLSLSGGNVVTIGSGYYDVIANITFTASTAGEVTVAIYSDGVKIPGATISVPGTANIEYAITIPAIIRNKCCRESIITVQADSDIILTNAAISVKKI